MERHFRVEFENGAELTLPVEEWLNQPVVRSMLAAALGRELSPPMSEEDWAHWVFETASLAEVEA